MSRRPIQDRHGPESGSRPTSARTGKRSAGSCERPERHGAAIVHFPEGAMSGCSKAQIKSWERFDWDVLVDELRSTAGLARELGLWVVVGSGHWSIKGCRRMATFSGGVQFLVR